MELIQTLLGRVGTLEERIYTLVDKALEERKQVNAKKGWFGGFVGPQAKVQGSGGFSGQ